MGVMYEIDFARFEFSDEFGPRIKMLCRQRRNSYYADKTVIRSSYIHNEISKLIRRHLYIDPESCIAIAPGAVQGLCH